MGPGRRLSARTRLAVAGAAVLLIGSACTSDGDGADEPDGSTAELELIDVGVLRLGIASPSYQFDPAQTIPTDQGQMITVDLLYDGLTAIDPETSEAVPALAGEWEAADEFTTWTFTLRDDAVFSDGSPITAADVKGSLERVAAQGTASLAGVRLDVLDGYGAFVSEEAEGITGITASEDGTQVTFETVEPYAPLPELLGSPILGVVPATAGELDLAAPVGSGPLMVSGAAADLAAGEDRPDSSEDLVVLDPSPGADLGIEGVTLVRFADVASSYEAFTDGELDWSLVPADLVGEAEEAFGAEAITPFHAEFFYGINVGLSAYEDRGFREALVRAVDRSAIVEEFFPNGSPLNGTVVRGVPGFRGDPCGVHCRYAPGRAQELVDGAFPDGDVPTVTLDFYEGDRERGVAEAIAEDLEHIGIPTELRLVEDDYETFVTSGDQEVFLFGWVGITPNADAYLAPLFLSGSPDNVTAFSSEAVNVGIAAARALEDPAERADAYQLVEQLVMSQVPVIPLAQVKTLAVVSGAVTGWQPQLDGTFVVGDVRLGE